LAARTFCVAAHAVHGFTQHFCGIDIAQAKV
jgi:hypothetical protein